jgi:hypothetical protein
MDPTKTVGSNVTLLTPVPSDIDISQSITPANIVDIAVANGILPEELDLYGKYKAKVSLSPISHTPSFFSLSR